jgi:tetratricopeptide (TPR) repeat protein
VYLAHAIRLAGLAREMRRKDIEARGKPGELFEESDEVQRTFRDALDAFDRVLAVDANHAKGWSMKAQALFRQDRGNRPEALAAYDQAVQALERSLPEGGPQLEKGRRTLLRGRRQIERPCDSCDDTGFCTECGGSGWRSTLGFRRRCEACLGHGVCKRCGVL